MPFRLLFLSTPVGPLGSGQGGGVELTLRNMALELQRRGHSIQVVAPAGSQVPEVAIAPVPGNLQTTAQHQERTAPVRLPPNSALAAMCELARQQQATVDMLVNFAYDWLPFYLTPFFRRPIAHLVSMGSLSDAMDQVIGDVVTKFPNSIGVHSWAQAATFPFAAQCRVLGNGFDLTQYTFQPEPEPRLAWVGRIAPEKGLEDAIAAAHQAQLPLSIWGVMANADYWQEMGDRFPEATFRYEGFRATADLQRDLGRCRGLLMTPRWVEAFGNVAVEALACGVPVIAYARGGPAEIVEDGISGWLVEPDSITELIQAIERLDQIDRRDCRRRAEATYSNAAMGDRVEQWLWDVYQNSGKIDRTS